MEAARRGTTPTCWPRRVPPSYAPLSDLGLCNDAQARAHIRKYVHPKILICRNPQICLFGHHFCACVAGARAGDA